MYAIFPAQELFAVLIIPKCGSETLRRNAMGVVDQVTTVDRLVFLRDPIDRFQSAYSFLSKLGAAPENYTDFVDWSFDIDDEHVAPQAEYVYQSGQKMYDHAYMLTDMDDVFTRRVGYAPVRYHESYHKKITDYRLDEIKQKYAADYDLIGGING